MPLFAFVCRDCEKASEILVRADESPVCPQCGSKHMEKQLSHFAPMRGAESGPPPAPACAGCAGGGQGCPYRS